MKIKKGIIIQQMQNDYILIDSGIVQPAFNGMIRLNKTSKTIIELLQNDELSKEELVDKLLEKYDAPKETITKSVDMFIEELSKTVILIDKD